MAAIDDVSQNRLKVPPARAFFFDQTAITPESSHPFDSSAGYMPMKRYSAFAIAREAVRYHTGWERAWRAPNGPHFLARTEDGGSFELAYDEAEDMWSVTSSSNKNTFKEDQR